MNNFCVMHKITKILSFISVNWSALNRFEIDYSWWIYLLFHLDDERITIDYELVSYSSLHYAVIQGKHFIIHLDLFIRYQQSDYFDQMKFSYSDFSFCLGKKKKNAIDSLLKNGENIYVKDKDKRTPLHVAIIYGKPLLKWND